MHPNHELLDRFYSAFSRRDADTMASCYADNVAFSDPAFPDLKGARAGAMWKMLCERGKDLKVTYEILDATDTEGHAHWEAWYTFSLTGGKVHNIIEASFKFKDGKIVQHTDVFDFWRWSRMALGLKGVLFGWLPAVKKAVQKQADKGLVAWEAKSKA